MTLLITALMLSNYFNDKRGGRAEEDFTVKQLMSMGDFMLFNQCHLGLSTRTEMSRAGHWI